MSMLHLFRKYFDPIEYRRVEQEKKRVIEVKAPEAKAPMLSCRVCGYQAETRHRYCPRCLAETMEPRR
jgi:rubrerythrin